MMNKQQMRWIKRAAFLALLPGFSALAGCALSGGGNDSTTPTPTPTPTPTTTTFVQVERLARPAINEGLVLNNERLNLWNSIPPSSDFDTSQAAQDLRTEAITTIFLVRQALQGDTDNTTSTAIAVAFLPDVMRVDTGITMNVSDTAYSFSLQNLGTNTQPTPCSGRKIEDDVVDITLSVLASASVTDNVSYTAPATGAPGDTNPALGHTELSGQAGPLQAADFPFLARPR